MENFTIYNEGKYDIKANAALKAERIGALAGRAAVSGLKATARGIFNGFEIIQTGHKVDQNTFAEIGLL